MHLPIPLVIGSDSAPADRSNTFLAMDSVEAFFTVKTVVKELTVHDMAQ